MDKEQSLHTNQRRCDNVIFDLGDVLFTWSSKTATSISPKTLHNILLSSTWFEYEKGNVEEYDCYAAVAAEFNVEASEVAKAFQNARDSLQSNPQMTALLHTIKQEPGVRFYAMSNISAPDWEVLKHKGTQKDWGLFERVFTSAEARERKPNLGFFHQVLAQTGLDPSRTAFVDDKPENVLSARSLGLHGIIYTTFDEVARGLKALFRDATAAGREYLQNNAKRMISVMSTGVELQENFTQLLILEQTDDPSLVDYIEYPRLSSFLKSGDGLTTADLPYDLDTTSIALTVSPHFSEETKHDVMNEIVKLKNSDDVVQTSFDATRSRINPFVCCNVLTLFHSNGRGDELSTTLDCVYDILEHKAFADGTLYEYGADAFFFFLSRLFHVSPAVRERFGPLFADRVSAHFGSPGDALALAMRVIAAATVGLADTSDLERLLAMQEVDGSWPTGWMYKYGPADILIGNKGLTTAFAVSAVKAYNNLNSA